VLGGKVVWSNWPLPDCLAPSQIDAVVRDTLQQLLASGQLLPVGGGQHGYFELSLPYSMCFLNDPTSPIAWALKHGLNCQELAVRWVAPGSVEVLGDRVRGYLRSGHSELLLGCCCCCRCCQLPAAAAATAAAACCCHCCQLLRRRRLLLLLRRRCCSIDMQRGC
jgi:hypothetical protein